jgi:DNA-binding transcriptional regulator GbsR (MarR family)
MKRDEIIKMARQAGCVEDKHYKGEVIFISKDALERFAKLVEDKVRQEIIEKNAPVIKKVNEHIKELQDAVKAEREACAKLCEDIAKGYEERAARPEEHRDINPEVARIAVMTCGFVKAAIRARGNA